MTALDILIAYPFLQRALVGALLVAAVCAVLGVFVVLRGLSMLGDGLAHVSFAGVALGFALGFYPLTMALLFSIVGALVIHTLRERQLVRGDTAIGIVFTAGLALGILVVSATQGFNVNVHAYLFGSLLAIQPIDLAVMAGLGGTLLLLLALLYKEFFYIAFSEEAARVSGLPVHVLNVLFVALTAASIVVAARVVGVLLVSALLIVPAASALQLARSFRGALALSVAFGLISVLAGVYAATEHGLATGASIALASTILFAAAASAGAFARRGRAVQRGPP